MCHFSFFSINKHVLTWDITKKKSCFDRFFNQREFCWFKIISGLIVMSIYNTANQYINAREYIIHHNNPLNVFKCTSKYIR